MDSQWDDEETTMDLSLKLSQYNQNGDEYHEVEEEEHNVSDPNNSLEGESNNLSYGMVTGGSNSTKNKYEKGEMGSSSSSGKQKQQRAGEYQNMKNNELPVPSMNVYTLIDGGPAKNPYFHGLIPNFPRKCLNYYCNSNHTTPMWRRGPLGPKTLCNACGIKYRKVVGKKKAENAPKNADA